MVLKKDLQLELEKDIADTITNLINPEASLNSEGSIISNFILSLIIEFINIYGISELNNNFDIISKEITNNIFSCRKILNEYKEFGIKNMPTSFLELNYIPELTESKENILSILKWHYKTTKNWYSTR